MVDRVAAVYIMRGDGSVLLQHRDDKPGLRHSGMWVPPGGHAEIGESMMDCARRELVEETEYEPGDLQLAMVCDRVYEDGIKYQAAYFWCWYDGLQQVVCHEGQELAFVNRREAENYIMPAHLLDVWDKVVHSASLFEERKKV